jgi:phytoene dehydrogenase-like protein
MSDESFDVVVIGGGLAGICCAGELVLEGVRTLLISESKEVGLAIRSRMVAGNRAIMQGPTYQVGWGGGWWPTLVRRLNVPVRVPNGFGPADYNLAIEGNPEVLRVPQSVCSAAGLTEALGEVFPFPAGAMGEVERILDSALAIPYPQLLRMHDVPLVQWLEDQKADEFVAHFMLMIAAAFNASTSTPEFSRENSSVFGAIGVLRSCFCGEAVFGYVYPDHREGMAMPLARAIEHRGGAVWRGRHVSHVNTVDGRVRSVILDDDTEIKTQNVAMACSNSRIRSLLDPLPPEVERPLSHGEKNAHKTFFVFGVLDKPAVPSDQCVGVLSPEGSMVQWMMPVHSLAPWCVQPGKQLVVSGTAIQVDELKNHGGEDAIYARLHNVTDCYYPGYKDALVATDALTHPSGNLWFGPVFTGPKLPRSVESVDGLWFVGENSTPVGGIWMEAAASAGILGARQIFAALKRASIAGGER